MIDLYMSLQLLGTCLRQDHRSQDDQNIPRLYALEVIETELPCPKSPFPIRLPRKTAATGCHPNKSRGTQMWAHSIQPTRCSSRRSSTASCVTHQPICTLRSPVALPTWTAHRGCSVRVYGLHHELLIVQRIGTVVSGFNNSARYLKNPKSTVIICHLRESMDTYYRMWKNPCDGKMKHRSCLPSFCISIFYEYVLP